VIQRLIISRWISEVPSKMVKLPDGGNQGFPAMAALMASSAVMPRAAGGRDPAADAALAAGGEGLQ
jgi:hypothetical protein